MEDFSQAQVQDFLFLITVFWIHIDPVASFRALKFFILECFRALKHYDPKGVFSHPKTLKIGEFLGPQTLPNVVVYDSKN
jgi:hypothetical protein